MGEMKQVDHTSGPWKFIDASKEAGYQFRPLCVIRGDGRQVAAFSWNDDSPYWPTKAQSQANARLIAAAPDLLDAARLALNYIENTEGELGIKLASGDALRAALSKAEGRSLSSASGQEGGE